MLDKRKATIWEALNIGPEWIQRDEIDELQPNFVPPSPTPSKVQLPVKSPKPEAIFEPVALASKLTEKSVLKAPKSAAPSATYFPLTFQSRAVDATAFSTERVEKIKAADWDALKTLVESCTVCDIGKKRTNAVFGEGQPQMRLVLVGEAPGQQEDLQGKPFVGASGKLLNSILQACELKRGKDLAILNTLKCRPDNNANPEESETRACRPFLERQIELLNPEIIVAMGSPAATFFLGPLQRLNDARGKVHNLDFAGKHLKLIVTYHPSYLLRSPAKKKEAWKDWCLVLDNLG